MERVRFCLTVVSLIVFAYILPSIEGCAPAKSHYGCPTGRYTWRVQTVKPIVDKTKKSDTVGWRVCLRRWNDIVYTNCYCQSLPDSVYPGAYVTINQPAR